MEPLKTDYKNDVLDASKNQLRKYQQIQNDDGTFSFVDVTEYSTTGTSFGAKDINDTNTAVNELNNSLISINNNMVKYKDISTYSLTNGNINLATKSELIVLSAVPLEPGIMLGGIFIYSGGYWATSNITTEKNVNIRVFYI